MSNSYLPLVSGRVGGKLFSEPEMVVNGPNELFASISIKTTAFLDEPTSVDDAISGLRSSDGSSVQRTGFPFAVFSSTVHSIELRSICVAVKAARTDLGNLLESALSRLFTDFLVFLSCPPASSSGDSVFPSQWSAMVFFLKA